VAVACLNAFGATERGKKVRAPTTVRAPSSTSEGQAMEFILWLIAVILVIAGVVTMVRGAILYGIVLIVVGLLVGPGGVSLFT
jgi:hypothetical protein